MSFDTKIGRLSCAYRDFHELPPDWVQKFGAGVKELDLSLMLQPFGYASPALKIYAFSRNQNMDRAAIWVLISQLLMAAPLALLWWRMRRMGSLHGNAAA